MNDSRPARSNIPMEEWVVEIPFDSSEYLKRSAVGADELPGYDPSQEADPDDNDLSDLDG